MQKALNAAQAQLNKITAPARSEDITLQRAQVAKAVASLDLIKNQLINNSIIAPTNGIITKVNYQVGEQASQGEAVMSMITENSYEIAIDVSETDIAKLQIGNQVSITLDAYGDDQVLTGLISFIEPAETVIQGVTYYKVKITFSAGTGIELKPGLTATAKIVTAQKDDVIAIPQRAVSDQDGQKIVKTLVNGSVVTKVVSLGLSGDGGLVEIISGLNGNEEIITSTKTNGQTP
jgi:membrane fusion protein (multidrug efflux system)